MNKAVTLKQLELTAGTESPLGKIKPDELDHAMRESGPVHEPSSAPFDWGSDNECIILHEQPATAVYFGGGGHLVIRQTNGHDDDVTILVAPENVTTFLEATAKRAREG